MVMHMLVVLLCTRFARVAYKGGIKCLVCVMVVVRY
jgi:hypothetical protein